MLPHSCQAIVSSESRRDHLMFKIDDVEQKSWSGEENWDVVSFVDINKDLHYLNAGCVQPGLFKKVIDYGLLIIWICDSSLRYASFRMTDFFASTYR
jgi:hypothetical protein